MIAESYELISDSPTKRIYEAVKEDTGRVVWQPTGRWQTMAGNQQEWQERWEMHCIMNPQPEHYSLSQGCKCQRRTGGCICFWRGKCAGEAFAGRRGGSKKRKSEFKNIRNFRMRKNGKLSGIIRDIWHTGSIVRIW